MYRWASSITISLLIINLYVLPVLDTRADTTKSVNVPSHGVITYSDDLNISQPQSKNLIKNPDFTNGMAGWDVEDPAWWNLDHTTYMTAPASLRCDYPGYGARGSQIGYGNHGWYIRQPITPGQWVSCRAWVKTTKARCGIGFDFRNAEGRITRGMCTGMIIPYDTDWTMISLTDDSQIRGTDLRYDGAPITLQSQADTPLGPEVYVTFHFTLRKGWTNDDPGDGSPASAWVDHAELYVEEG